MCLYEMTNHFPSDFKNLVHNRYENHIIISFQDSLKNSVIISNYLYDSVKIT